MTIRDPDAVTHPVQWWDVGASGDCRTRTSDIAMTSGDFSNAPAFAVGIPLIEGGTHDIELRLTGVFDDGIGFARAGEHEALFRREEVVAPTFAPVP